MSDECIYCDDKHDVSIIDDENVDVYLYGNELNCDVSLGGQSVGLEVKIKFCPMCGRKL